MLQLRGTFFMCLSTTFHGLLLVIVVKTQRCQDAGDVMMSNSVASTFQMGFMSQLSGSPVLILFLFPMCEWKKI